MLEQLPELLDQLNRPFKVAKPNSIKIAGLDIGVMEGNRVHCLDVITKLFTRSIGVIEDDDENGHLYKTWINVKLENIQRNFPKRIERKQETTTQELRKQQIAATIIQKRWKS